MRRVAGWVLVVLAVLLWIPTHALVRAPGEAAVTIGWVARGTALALFLLGTYLIRRHSR